VIAHRFQKDQAISAAFAASEHQQIRINRVLFRLRNAAETLIATQQTSNDASYLPQNGAARFLVALLKSQRLAIEGVKFSDDELAAIGPTRSLLLIELEERGRVLASACGTVIEEVENSNSTAGAATFAISRVKENGDFGQYILTRYNALGQPHT
jgi:hypothetical protein